MGKHKANATHFTSGRRMKAKHCRSCNAFVVLVGGATMDDHECGEWVEHPYEKMEKAKGWKKGR